MDLRSLRHLLVLARRLNYLRAADELGITQPTLTRSIQALERELDVRLFDRDRGGSVRLTPQGRHIAERAAALVAEAEDLARYSKAAAQGEGGRVRFGMAPMPARALLPKALSERLNAAPQVSNEVVVRDVEALWGMLIGGEIEFFVSQDHPLFDPTRARVELLGEFPLGLIVRAGHPLLQEKPAPKRYPLLRASWSGISVPSEAQDLILTSPNIVEDFAVLASVTASTDAIWLSTAYAIEAELRDGLLAELWRAPQRIEVNMYTSARRSLSPGAEAVAAVLRRQVELLAPGSSQPDFGITDRAD